MAIVLSNSPLFLPAVFSGIKPLWDEAAFLKCVIFSKYLLIVRLAHKSSSDFSQQRARERELDLFPLQKIASSDVIWRELFASLSRASSRAVKICQDK